MSYKNINFRPEIQGLRAIAVLIVIIFHVWPEYLQGGYIGVDVFFVISGYLITGILLREVEQGSTINLVKFYSNRVRRLLPAATFVLVISAIAAYLLPVVQWEDQAKEVLASTLYVQNWWLASQAVNYLAENNPPGLLRHYWSLSVEEQYYIIWPLFFWFIFSFLGLKVFRPRKLFFGVLLIAGLVSLVYSILLSGRDPGLAYFATTTRAWELAAGGLLSVILPNLSLPPLVRHVVSWVGLGMIALACLVFDQTTSFPSYRALLPVIGAVFVIAGGSYYSPTACSYFLSLKFFQYIGDISYSLYLWHWPLIVVFKLYLGESFTFIWGFSVVVISIVLAHFTKKYVEDFFRYKAKEESFINISALTLTSLCFAVSFLASNYIWLISNSIADVPVDIAPPSVRHALKVKYDPEKPTIPALSNARKDNPDVYKLKCHVNQTDSEPKNCVFGLDKAEKVIALVGDSHAAQWLPSLQDLIKRYSSWKVITYTKSACAFNETPVAIRKGQKYISCVEWNRKVLIELDKIKPDIIVTSQSSNQQAFNATSPLGSQKQLAEGLLSRWKQLNEIGAKVVVIKDTPWMEHDVPKCLASQGSTIESCSTPRSRAFKKDPILLAMEKQPKVNFIDFSDIICNDIVCPPTQGQVLLWRDAHHLTATYARTLSDEFEKAIF